jgi:cell division protease FtsH
LRFQPEFEIKVRRGAAFRELLAQARSAAPSVVFIDELDAVGGKRGLGVNESDQTLSQLLTELDLSSAAPPGVPTVDL